MADGMVDNADERAHAAGTGPHWEESWYLDFAASDLSYGGYVRLGLYPNLGRSWLWVYLVGRDRPLVAVRDHDLPCPRGGALQVTANGARWGVAWLRCPSCGMRWERRLALNGAP